MDSFTAAAPGAPTPRRTHVARPLLVFAAGIAVLAAVLNPPVLNAIRDAVGRTKEKKAVVYRRALFSLPTPGRLLVDTSRGPWIIRADGGRRLLGRYHDASWSPRGLYVAALGPHDLVALEPNGTIRWSLARSGRLATPRWSPELGGSTRIAYMRGRTLRVVAGDGTDDRLLDGSVSPVAAAWRPGTPFVVAYQAGTGRIRVVATDEGKFQWRSFRLPQLTALAWSSDGMRLLALTPRSLTVFGRDGRRIGHAALPAVAIAAQFEPGGHEIALLLRYPQQSAVVLRDGDAPAGASRVVFSAAGRFDTLAWSPNGRWLLAGWQSADAFLFLTPSGKQDVVSDIGRQLGTFPSVPQAGWCCVAAG